MNEPSKMRAGLALALLVPAPSMGAVAGMILYQGPVGQTVYLLSKVWMVLLPTVWWLSIEKQKPSWSAAKLGGFGVATVLGAALSAVIIVGYYLVGVHVIDAQQIRQVAAGNGLDHPGRYLVLCAYLILVNSVLEEYVYRWFIFRQFERLMPGWAAVLAAAGAFTVHHTIVLVAQLGWPAAILGTVGVYIGGALWSWLYLRYRSIWPGYLCHAIVDVAVLIVGWVLIFG